jgi:hemerythrin-like domain-containing protein
MSGERPKQMMVNAAFLQEIKEDHQQLQKLLSDIEHLLENRVSLNNHPRNFLVLLDELVDQIGLHFTLEEAYGYFEVALDEAPRFHEPALKLRDQHRELYVMLQKIAESAATACEAAEPQLNPVADQFTAFHTALKAHESAELNLILEAMNRDMGFGD